MRFFLNIFGRNNQSTEQQLENIAESLKKIDEKRKVNLDNEKRLIGSLLLYSFMVYFMCTAVTLVYVKPSETHNWAIYLGPLIVFPFLIFYVKRFIHWFYVRRLRSADQRLTNLKLQRKQLLTDVIEKETYKRANELLNKFDPNFEFRKEYEGFDGTKLRANSDHNSDSELNKTCNTPKSIQLKDTTKTASVMDLRPKSKDQMLLQQKFKPPMEVQLPRPLLKQQRTSLDKIIDYMVGDGFDHRYALICRHCHCHNGMSLAEEFEFLSFKCAYCQGFNPARKLLPDPPKISVSHITSSSEPVANRVVKDNSYRNVVTRDAGDKESTVVHRERQPCN